MLDKEIDRLDAVVKRFLDFTRPMDMRLEATQLAELLKEVLEVAQPQLQKANIQVAQLLPIDVPEVYVDRALLKQAVLNLVLNAAEAMPSGGQLRLVLSRRGEMAEITRGRHRQRNSARRTGRKFSSSFLRRGRAAAASDSPARSELCSFTTVR